MFLRMVQYAKAPIIARGTEVARRFVRTPVSRGLPAKAESRRTPAARLRGLYSAIVATGLEDIGLLFVQGRIRC